MKKWYVLVSVAFFALLVWAMMQDGVQVTPQTSSSSTLEDTMLRAKFSLDRLLVAQQELSKKYPPSAGIDWVNNPMNRSEATKLASDVLIPISKRFYESYPIPALHQKFRDAIDDKKVLPSPMPDNVFNQYFSGFPPLAFTGQNPQDKNEFHIEMVCSVWRVRLLVIYVEYKDDKERQEVLEDLFLATYLHEYYHIRTQRFWVSQHSAEYVQEKENECWRYTCEEILKKMRMVGRGKTTSGSTEGDFYNSFEKNDQKKWKETLDRLYH